MSYQIPAAKLAELLAKARAHKEKDSQQIKPHTELQDSSQSLDRYGNSITLNSKQSEFVTLATSMRSCILIGAAGTGKTTTMRAVIESLTSSCSLPILSNLDHKYLPHSGVPGIVACSYTRRAVSNLRKAMPPGLEGNCITIHKLLEYQPIYETIFDPETGEEKSTMRFLPTRNSYNPISPQIRTIIIDEASMVSVELFQLLLDALPHNPQFIFLGDIQQLPPVFGSAILGYKLLELPTVELTEVYRTAGTIIKYATQIKEGTTLKFPENFSDSCTRSKITFHPWKKRIRGEDACMTFCRFITNALDSGAYNPEEDMILIPFNKAFGTEEINKSIANHIAKAQGRKVFEVISGFNRLYFSEGDRVLYDKEDAQIVSIKANSTYLGPRPKPASVTLDYHGYDPIVRESEESSEDIDSLLNSLSDLGDTTERVKAASHVITVQMLDSGAEIELTTASELNSLLLSYTLTVHKSQGSEWRKVFLVLHQSHATMIQRELLYTAVTRAKEELYVICEPDTFVKGVQSQRIKGNDLKSKAEYFKGKLETNKGIKY